VKLRLRLCGILIVLLGGLASSSVASPVDAGLELDSAQKWLTRARESTKKTFSIRAKFKQELFHRLKPESQTMYGVAEVRRGGRVRLTYKRPKVCLLISDGQQLWSYDPKSQTAILGDPADSLLLRLFGILIGDGAESDFIARHIGGGLSPGVEPAAIELVPRKRDSSVASIVVTLKGKEPQLLRVLIVDHGGTVIRITLSNIQYNVGLPGRLFSFELPKGAKVVHP
jgi:outer membrane lipoprotein-sorting protein